MGVSAPRERMAAAQGMLGAAETLTGGLTAVLAGVLYSVGGRVLAYTVCAVVMVVMAIAAYVIAGPDLRNRRSAEVVVVDDVQAPAVTGHA